MKKNIALIGTMVSLLLLFSTANATIWYVHPDSILNSIQAGLDTAFTGDTVLVAPGTYTEAIRWPRVPQIKLMSEFGPEVTVIDANIAGHVIYMAENLTPATIIDGFTIMNGWARSYPGNGGGIYCTSTSPTIKNNIIKNNTAYSGGGGIYFFFGAPRIIGNIILDNISSYKGGGVSCNSAQPLILIQENYFHNNTTYGDGGAIDCWGGSDPTIQYNQILNNNATYGGGLSCDRSCRPPTHYNNISANEVCGVYNADTSGSYAVPAENNWWGHPAGPESGDTICGPVDYNPWLPEEIVFDIAVISIEAPPDTVIPGASYTPGVTVRNNCNFACPVSFFTAQCFINGYQDYVRIDQALSQDSTLEVAFADWTVGPQDSTTYLIRVTLYYAVDKIASNDTISKQIIARHTGLDEREIFSPPLSFTLAPNYPNPFNAITEIKYTLPRDCRVRLDVFNALGQKVATLVDGQQKAGYKTARWVAGSLSSGIYFYRLQAGDFVQTRKVVLLK